MLGNVDVGASDEHRLVGDPGTRGPYFLAVDHPRVTVELRPTLEAGQVRSGVGLAEELAERVGAHHHAGQVARLLVVGAVVEERRRGHAGGKPRRCGHGAEVTYATGYRPGEGRRQSPPEPRRGIVAESKSRLGESLPPVAEWEVRVPVALQPVMKFGPERVVAGDVRHLSLTWCSRLS